MNMYDKQLAQIIADLTAIGAMRITPQYIEGILVYVDYILNGKFHTMHVNSLL